MNRIFNKLNGVLLAGLLGGVMVFGLGTGIAFAEYMDFEYVAYPNQTEEQTVVEDFSYEMSPDETVFVPAADEIQLDKSVPAGTLLVSAEYSPLAYAVENRVYESAVVTGATSTVFEVNPFYIRNDFEEFMQSKDVILEGLKNKQIVGIDHNSTITLTVKINPADRGRVFANYDSAARALEG